MVNNIRPFREEPNWLNKIGIALVYIVLGWVLVRTEPGAVGNLLSMFLLLGILVWAIILRQRTVKYFVRYHVAQSILLNLSLAAIIWLVFALLDVLAATPGLSTVGALAYSALFQPIAIGTLFTASAKDMFVMATALSLAIYCLRGRYTELPWITDGVRHWV